MGKLVHDLEAERSYITWCQPCTLEAVSSAVKVPISKINTKLSCIVSLLFNIILSQWGSTAISTVLIFVVVHLIKKINTNSKKEEERLNALRGDINKTLDGFGARLSAFERDYVKSEYFFRELSGWKSEINRLSDQITNQFMAFSQNILQIFSQGKK